MNWINPLTALPIVIAWLALPLLVMTAQPGYPLAVQVVTEAGLPVRDVQVAVFAPDGSRLDSGQTDAQGHYRGVFTHERVAVHLEWIAPTGTVIPLGTVNDVDTMRLWIDLTIGDPEVAFVVTDRAIILAPSMLAPDVGGSLLPDPSAEASGSGAESVPLITPLPFPSVAPSPSSPAPDDLRQGQGGAWRWVTILVPAILVVMLAIFMVRARQRRNPQ